MDSNLLEDKPSEVGSYETPLEVSNSDGVFQWICLLYQRNALVVLLRAFVGL